MFALSGDSRPLGENDDVGGVLEERWRQSRHLSSLFYLNEPSFSTGGWESTSMKFI